MYKKILGTICIITAIIMIFAACGSNSDGLQENEQPANPVVFDLSSAKSGDQDVDGLILKYGKIESVIYANYDGENVVVVKADVDTSTSSETIDVNYQNAVQLIKTNGLNTCQEFQYWAVSDLLDGEKSISFTLDKETIDGIYNGSISADDVRNHVTDEWLH